MKRLIGSMAGLWILAAALGLAANALNPHGIALVGRYAPVEFGADSIIIPPSAEPSDPPFITLQEAYGKYHDPGTVFLDAREPEDYAAGHIRGAVNLPFERIDEFWPAVEPLLARDAPLVIYCSGADCELSLHEARFLRSQGYPDLFVFYGGWLEWSGRGFPVEPVEAK